MVVAILAGIGAVVLYLRSHGSADAGPTTPVTASGSASPTSQSSSAPVPRGPVSVVTAYYDAVNNHQYATAYRLNEPAQRIESFATFKQGFTGTQHDDFTITNVSGDQVSFDLSASQTDGTVKTYAGTYIVRNGKIVDANVRQTS